MTLWSPTPGSSDIRRAVDHLRGESAKGRLERATADRGRSRRAHPDGVPRPWLQRVRASPRTALRGFSADRMLDDGVSRVYLGAS